MAAALDDLDRNILSLLQQDADIPALHGWRLEVFGKDALRLKRGEIALSAAGGAVRVVPLA